MNYLSNTLLKEEREQMTVSILEALQNAEHNLMGSIPEIKSLGMNQLHNAIVLLEKGYGADTAIEPLLAEVNPLLDGVDVPNSEN